MSAEPGSTEYLMEFSQYGDGAAKANGAEADARRIQSALLSEGFVGDQRQGFALTDYIGEILDDQALSEISGGISAVLIRLVPDVAILAQAVEAAEDKRTLLIGFTIAQTDPATRRTSNYSFALQVALPARQVVIRNFTL